MTGTGEGQPARFLEDPAGELARLLSQALAELAEQLPLIGAAAVVVVVALVGAVLARRRRQRSRAAGARLLRIAVPPQVDVGQAELLWAGLHDLLRPRLARLIGGQPQVAWEITGDEAGIAFQMWLPQTVPPGLAERALLAAWPGATLTQLEPNAGAIADGEVLAGTELALSGPDCFPIGGYGGDPLRLLLGQLADVEAGVSALVQVVCRPATVREQARLRATARRLKQGVPTSRAARLLDLATPASASRVGLDPTVAPDVRAVLEKASQPLFLVAVRVAVAGPTRPVARGRIHGVAGAFAAYEGRVGFRRRRLRSAHRKLGWRVLGRRGFLLSVSELAGLCHLPAEPGLPGLARAGSRSVAPPPGLATAGKQLGLDTRGREVALTAADARYHLHLLGPTGVGKSTLIARLALGDLASGRGAVVIDPKGDLIEEILQRIPEDSTDRVDLLDPLDHRPPGLNVLEGDDHDLVVDQLVGIFRRVFERFWGPRTDDILRVALLTLRRAAENPDANVILAGEGATLADVPKLLTDEQWRRQLVDELEDPLGVEPFWAWYDSLGEAMRAQATGPVLNKLRAFLLRRPVRAIVGQPTSTIDIASVLDQGRLLLVRVPKGTLGEDTSRLLGSFVVARVWQAAIARASRAESNRPDCSLYVDEVHNYLSLPTPLEEMLAEARGYRLSLCLAHQHLAQLPREMREAISANARTKIYFQLSPHDAHALGKDVEPELSGHDLAHLPRHTAAVRLCQQAETGPAFTLTTQPLAAGDPDTATLVRQRSRQRNGRDRDEVDAAITRRHGFHPSDNQAGGDGSDGSSDLASTGTSNLASGWPEDPETREDRRRCGLPGKRKPTTR